MGIPLLCKKTFSAKIFSLKSLAIGLLKKLKLPVLHPASSAAEPVLHPSGCSTGSKQPAKKKKRLASIALSADYKLWFPFVMSQLPNFKSKGPRIEPWRIPPYYS